MTSAAATNRTADRDASSLSNPQIVPVTHLSWSAAVDFDTRTISATATYDVRIVVVDGDGGGGDGGGGGDDGPSSSLPPSLWLDTRGLTIQDVTVDGTRLDPDAGHAGGGWTLEEEVEGKPHLGRRLVIPLASAAAAAAEAGGGRATEATATSATEAKIDPNSVQVAIRYETSSNPAECTAIQWLPPSQTAGKVRPYLFTQCQAIHARSLVPCQDLPGNKFTYDADVTVPGWATAVMSALPGKSGGGDGDDGGGKGGGDAPSGAKVVHRSKRSHSVGSRRTFSFRQPVPVPSYLLALAVGNLTARLVSPRVSIHSEPEIVDAAAYEFAQTEHFLRAAEELTGIPYPWGRYDLLVLPPSFPYGGMENPCLTFVTPTLLAGDRSLADVVAHEISHSWTGNLVTNATWGHFWLNEGWTTWLQRKIMSHRSICGGGGDSGGDDGGGDDGASKNGGDEDGKVGSGVYGLDALGGWKHLSDDVTLHSSASNASNTRLVLTLGDGDPDESYSSIPYEKGFNLLHCLEQMVGSDEFLEFARAYIDRFKYGTVTSEQFRSFFGEYFRDNKSVEDAVSSSNKGGGGFDWDEWLYGTGMPPKPYEPNFDRSLAEGAEALARRWLDYDTDTSRSDAAPSAGDDVDLSTWSTSQRTWFLDVLLTETDNRGFPLRPTTVASLTEQYGFLTTKNAEVLFRYLMLAVPTAKPTAKPAAGPGGPDKSDVVLDVLIRFVTTQGRMKYVRPLYRALRDSDNGRGRELAVRTFWTHKDFYHPIAAKMVAGDLAVGGDGGGGGGTKKSDAARRKGLLLAGAAAAAAVAAVAVGIALVRAGGRSRR